MYNITLPILGTRLKQIREHIGYSQAQLAEQLNCKQNAISNLELGKGGSLKLLFQVLNFYSNYVFIDLIFSEKFYLISNTEEDEAQKANYNSVIIEIIRQSEKNYEDAMSNAKKELEANLQKAISGMSHKCLMENRQGKFLSLFLQMLIPHLIIRRWSIKDSTLNYALKTAYFMISRKIS